MKEQEMLEWNTDKVTLADEVRVYYEDTRDVLYPPVTLPGNVRLAKFQDLNYGKIVYVVFKNTYKTTIRRKDHGERIVDYVRYLAQIEHLVLNNLLYIEL